MLRGSTGGTIQTIIVAMRPLKSKMLSSFSEVQSALGGYVSMAHEKKPATRAPPIIILSLAGGADSGHCWLVSFDQRFKSV